ncbi:hypothetical protein Ctob_005934, partial [Chrysochromulina tobinii]
ETRNPIFEIGSSIIDVIVQAFAPRGPSSSGPSSSADALNVRNVNRAILEADNSPRQPMVFRTTMDGCALLPPKLHQALSELDTILIKVLLSGAIRLLRVEWLMKQLDNFKMPNRQALEEIERSGVSPSPLLNPQEAVALVERGDRSIGALTYGWLMAGDPDPKGSRFRVLRRALKRMAIRIEALFWDFGSLYQAPRTPEQSASFKLALEGGAMNQLYASILATTVLQIEEIPPRPAEFDGVVCLFKLSANVDENKVRAALIGFGIIESCDLSHSPPIVRFASHASAVAAKNAGAWPGLCEGLDTLYNETPYFSRGWCCCEDSLSRELMKRLTAYPALRVHLDQLQPKVFALSSDADATPIEVEVGEFDVAADIERINKSKFTSKGDHPVVVGLYTKYVHDTVGALTKTLGSLQMLVSGIATAAPAEPLPHVDAPAASPLRLAEGQPLLLLSWQGNGAGGGPRFGVVDATGGRVAAAVMGGDDDAELAYDRCSQAVLPWRPPAAGWEAAFIRDARALRDLVEPARRLADDARRMESESALRAVGERAREIADGAARCQSIAHAAREAGSAVRSCVDKAATLFKAQQQGDPKQLQEALGKVCAAIERLQPVALEAMLTAALRSSGASGARRYAAGQPLTVRTAGGWRDADVATAGADGLRHGLTFLEGSGEPPATLTLHPWNHAPRELPHAAYEAMHEWWTRKLRKEHTQIFDALSGNLLDALQQCVAIEVMGDADLAGVRDVRGLSDWLHSLHASRSRGEAITAPGAALLTAPPAAGKTTLISQAVVLALDRAELVPIVIKVQLLQAKLRDAPDAFASHWNWVDAYLSLKERPEVHRMLRQAMMARRALLLLDGLDEAGAKRAEIEQHVVEVLAPQGHVMLCTSRPAGVVEARFSGFRMLKLAPLTEAQQEQALLQRLGNEGDVRQLMTFVERMPTS